MLVNHPRIEHTSGELSVRLCYFSGLSWTEGSAICDKSSGRTVVEKSGFLECTASSRAGSILKENGNIALSSLCFEACSVVGAGNYHYGYCADVEYARGLLSLCTAWKCGLEHLKYGDTPFSFQNSAANTEDVNTSFCYGWGTPGVTYWYNTEISVEIHTVYACGSGEMADELNSGKGSFTSHNVINCSTYQLDYCFYFYGGTVTLTECCYFGNSYSSVCYGNYPNVVKCLAYPTINGFGRCEIGNLHTQFLKHKEGCNQIPSLDFTKSINCEWSYSMLVSLLLLLNESVEHAH